MLSTFHLIYIYTEHKKETLWGINFVIALMFCFPRCTEAGEHALYLSYHVLNAFMFNFQNNLDYLPVRADSKLLISKGVTESSQYVVSRTQYSSDTLLRCSFSTAFYLNRETHISQSDDFKVGMMKAHVERDCKIISD